VTNAELSDRIDQAIRRGLPLVRASLPAVLSADSAAIVW